MTTRQIVRSGWLLASFFFCGSLAFADTTPALSKTPGTITELRDLEKKVKAVTKKVMPAVVGLEVGGASGSGVIINEEGIILTAGHVSGQPHREVSVILPDGKRIKGETLGANRQIDSGMIKITTPGKYPFVPMGDSTKLAKGQWCFALGHPGGFKPSRTPVLRVGRVLDTNDKLIQTDCTLVGGDSGGPLFDIDGNVIGIHSRIGGLITYNIHVPVATYAETWERLAAAETWGIGFGGGGPRGPRTVPVPTHGLSFEANGGIMKIIGVEKNSPAEKAGLKVKDFLKKLDGQEIKTKDEIDKILRKKKPGEEVALEIARAGETVTLKLVLGKP